MKNHTSFALVSVASLVGAAAITLGSPVSTTLVSQPRAATTSKMMVIVLENKTRKAAEPLMPYMVSLQKQYGYSTGMHSTIKPSLGNYMMMGFGSNFGIKDDKPPSVHAQHGQTVFGNAIKNGLTAKVYAEADTVGCGLVDNGLYDVHHTGWPYALDERAICHANSPGLVPAFKNAYTANALPTLSWVIGDEQHDGHKPSTAQAADKWIKTLIDPIRQTSDFTSGALTIVITFDEGSAADTNVSFVVINSGLSHKVVTTNQTHHDFYNWELRVGGSTGGTDAGTGFGL